jgi:hypothetical protein
LIEMPGDPDPIRAGAMGTVAAVRKHGTGRDARMQVNVGWDNGRKLMLSVSLDRVDFLSYATAEY